MELRVLQYFLAVAREESISGAAEFLHLSQPTLSRQLKDLEDELGKKLFIRGNRKISLTEEGMLLRKRAEEITTLVKKTEDEISLSDEAVAGEITIGAAESDGIRFLARVAGDLQREYPLIRFRIISGDRADITADLDKGLIDFGLVFGDIDPTEYDCLPLEYKDVWGVIMRKDAPLAKKKSIRSEDLRDKPLIISRQAFKSADFKSFFGCDFDGLNIVATYNLIFNGSIMADEGLGYALGLDKIVNVSGDSNLCFIPLEPRLEAEMSIIWKKYRVHSKAVKKYLKKLREALGNEE